MRHALALRAMSGCDGARAEPNRGDRYVARMEERLSRGRRDRHRVDVSLALPRQRVPKPPPLRLERGERALHLVLRVGADSTATSERKPVPGVETQPDGHDEQQPADRRRSRARDYQPEQPATTLPSAALPA
jgi:hypothetical protein